MSDPLQRLATALRDRYAIEREIGQGGMATVYLAEDLKHHRKVALKVLRPELTAIIGSERFLKEIEVTANLQHPNILPLYDSGEADSLLYYVMPYVDGESLRQKMDREKQLGVDETIEIAKSIAGALQYAHERGIVHRDVKPENILLQSGQALVADFGIALALSAAGGTRITETGLSLGTPHYMSPEQATGDRELDARSDIYSLGAMVYEMLTGDPPHHGNTMQAIIAKILAEHPAPIAQTRELVPMNVDAAVHRALAKTPADRFSSAGDFAAALANPNFTLPTMTGVTASAVAATESQGRLRAVGALAAVFLVAAAWGWLRPTPEAPRLVLRYQMTMPLEMGLVNDIGTNMAISPDGSKLVYAGAEQGQGRLWLRDRDKLDAVVIPGTEQGFHPFFSPDGQRIGFVTQNRQLKVVSLGGEPPITLVDANLRRAGGAWGEDGYIYFVGGTETGLSRVPATGGEVEVVTNLDPEREELRHRYPYMLPGARGVIFTVARRQLYDADLTEIAVADLETGEHRALLAGVQALWSPTGHLIVLRADGALLAAPFDVRRMELTGPAIPILEGIGMESLASADLVLSESGTLIYAPGTAGDPYEVSWVERDGAATPIDADWSGLFNYPSLSPDGTRLAMTIVEPGGETHTWIKLLDRGPLSKLTFEGSTNYRATWAPDGRHVVWISNRGTTFEVYRRRADGSAQPELVLSDPEPIDEVRYSPDGEWLLYRVSRSGSEGDLYGLRIGSDTTPVPLIATNFSEVSPAVSPDGRWLAYTSNESGQPEIYVRPFPNTGDSKWQVSTNGGTEPVWAHNGQELFYRSGNDDMVAAEVLRGSTFAVGQQAVLFSTAGYRSQGSAVDYDIAPDDERFVMVRLRASAFAGEVIVVENWLEELKDRMRR